MTTSDDDADPSVIEPADAALLDELRLALGADPPPDDLAAICRQLIEVVDLDTHLTAFLVEHTDVAAGVRGGVDPGAPMVFEPDGADVAIEVVVAQRIEVSVIGDAVRAVLQRPGEPDRAVDLDEFGTGSVVLERRGPVRLQVELSDGRTVATEWFVS